MYINVDDPPKLTDLSKNDRLALVYNEVVNHIARLKASGRIPEGMDLNAEGITSQIILESGWGGSRLAKESNNFGGLTAGKAWKGPVDIVENDPITGKTYNYRVFNSPLEGIQAQVEFYLPDVNSRYAKAGVLTAKNSDEHFARVKAAGYAEDAKYVSKLSSFVRSTIRPRLKRGGDQEAINEWYTAQNNYQNNEEFAEVLNKESQEELAKLNSLEQDLQQDDQTFLEYQKKAENISTPQNVTQNNQSQQEILELDPSTLNTLNLQDYSKNIDNNQLMTPNIANIQGNQTKIFSDETEKQNAQIAAQQMKKEDQLQQIINASIMEDNNSSFGQGILFGADKRTGGYINRFNNGGTMYPKRKYYNPGGPLDNVDLSDIIGEENSLINKPGYGAKKTVKKFDSYMNPAMLDIDPETENLKVYNPKTGTYDISNQKFDFSSTGAIGFPMSHPADMYEASDKSPEAIAAREEKAQWQLELAKEQASRGQRQIATRAENSAENLESLKDQGVSQGFRNWLGSGYQCMSGSSACLSPNPNDPDEVTSNYVTSPYFSNKGFKPNTKSTVGTQKTGSGTTYPGQPLPVISGNESFASSYPQYGMEMQPKNSPLIPGQIQVMHAYDRGYNDNRQIFPYFQYGKGSGAYHAVTIGDKTKDGYNVLNNPVAGPFRWRQHANTLSDIDNAAAQFNYVGDSPYYKRVLADIQNKNNLVKND